MPEAPPGVRVAPPPGCAVKAAPAPNRQDEAVRAGRAPGFVDLGNGVEVRISGRVRAEAVARH